MGCFRSIPLLVLFSSLFFTQKASAQKYQFNCFQHAAYSYEHKGDTNWVDTSYSLIVDFEKKKVYLRNKTAREYDIIRYSPLRKEVNGSTIVCQAVDNEGDMCSVELTLFNEVSFHVATLVVRYTTIIRAYRLQRPRT